jgi:hypothetical protein
MNPKSKRRLTRIPFAKADAEASPDLLAIIKEEGKV